MVTRLLVVWRQEAGLSQAEAGRRMDFGSTATVHGHEHGRTRVSPELLARYAEVYGRTQTDLIAALLLLAGVEGGIGPSNSGQDEAPSAEVAAP